MSSLTALAEEALKHAKALDAYLASKNLPSTTFQIDSLKNLPIHLSPHRDGLINTSQTLKQLAQGPATVLAEMGWACTDEISLGAIYDYQLAKAVPLDGSATFAEISQASGHLSEDLVERLLRHAMGNHIFTEDSRGFVKHTASSRLLVTDAEMNDLVGFRLREVWQTAGQMRHAMVQYADSQNRSDTAFGLANTPGVPMFEHLSKYPERARRFGGAMQAFAKIGGWNLEYLVRGYNWSSVDQPGATIVDVGGGHGAVATAIAKATEHLHLIVQDLAGTVEEGRRILPSELKDRISFMAHDFFTEQPVKGAKVYFFRWILHDWPDIEAVRILQSLVPALRDWNKIVFYEVLLADGPETRWTANYARNADLIMLAQFNSRERTLNAFKSLLSRAHNGFKVTNSLRPEGSNMDIIEVIWRASNR